MIDREAYHNWKASEKQEQASKLSYQDTRDLVVREAAGLYLDGEVAFAEVEAAESRVTTSEALEKAGQRPARPGAGNRRRRDSRPGTIGARPAEPAGGARYLPDVPALAGALPRVEPGNAPGVGRAHAIPQRPRAPDRRGASHGARGACRLSLPSLSTRLPRRTAKGGARPLSAQALSQRRLWGAGHDPRDGRDRRNPGNAHRHLVRLGPQRPGQGTPEPGAALEPTDRRPHSGNRTGPAESAARPRFRR